MLSCLGSPWPAFCLAVPGRRLRFLLQHNARQALQAALCQVGGQRVTGLTRSLTRILTPFLSPHAHDDSITNL